MKQGNRKVDEQLRAEIANAMLFDISDPRLSMVTITGCKVSFDRAYADIFYIAEPGRYDEVAKAFTQAKGHLRSILAAKLNWKKSPELRFHLDETIDDAAIIEAHLQKGA